MEESEEELKLIHVEFNKILIKVVGQALQRKLKQIGTSFFIILIFNLSLANYFQSDKNFKMVSRPRIQDFIKKSLIT